MCDEFPFAVALHENVCCLHQGIIEAIGEGAGDLLCAGYPADVSFRTNPDRAERHFHSPSVGENSDVTFAHFFPAEEEFPTGVDALDPVFVGPDFFERGDIHGLEGGVETAVRVSQGLFRRSDY